MWYGRHMLTEILKIKILPIRFDLSPVFISNPKSRDSVSGFIYFFVLLLYILLQCDSNILATHCCTFTLAIALFQVLEDELISKHMKTIVDVSRKESFHLSMVMYSLCFHPAHLYSFIRLFFYVLSKITLVTILIFQMENSGVIHMLKNNKTSGKLIQGS